MEASDSNMVAIRPTDSDSQNNPSRQQMSRAENPSGSRQDSSSVNGVTVQHPPDSDTGTPPPTREVPTWQAPPPFFGAFGFPQQNGPHFSGGNFPNGMQGFPPQPPQGQGMNQGSQAQGFSQDPNSSLPPGSFPPNYPNSSQYNNPGDGSQFPGNPSNPMFPPNMYPFMGNGMDPMQMMMSNPFQAAMAFGGGGMNSFFPQQQQPQIVVNQFYFNGTKKTGIVQKGPSKSGKNASPVLIEIDDETSELETEDTPDPVHRAPQAKKKKKSPELGQVCKLCANLLDPDLLPRFETTDSQRVHARKHSEQNDKEIEDTLRKCFDLPHQTATKPQSSRVPQSPKNLRRSEKEPRVQQKSPEKIDEPNEEFLELSENTQSPKPAPRSVKRRRSQRHMTQDPPEPIQVSNSKPTPPPSSQQIRQTPSTIQRQTKQEAPKVAKPAPPEPPIKIIKEIVEPPKRRGNRAPEISQPLPQSIIYPQNNQTAAQQNDVTQDPASAKVSHQKFKQAMKRVMKLAEIRCQFENCNEVIEKRGSPVKHHLLKHFAIDPNPCPQCKLQTRWFSTLGHENCDTNAIRKQMMEHEEVLVNCTKLCYSSAFDLNPGQIWAIMDGLSKFCRTPPSTKQSDVGFPVEEEKNSPGEGYKAKLKKLMSFPTNPICEFPNCNKPLLRTSTTVQNHIVNHFQIECFKCRICGQIVKPWSLGIHARIHDGQKDYEDLREGAQAQLCSALDTCFPSINE